MQAEGLPGKIKIYVPLETPARALDCIVDVPILLNERKRKSSPKPSISLSKIGLKASGETSLPVNPVPPVEIMTSTFGFLIHIFEKQNQQ